MHFVCLDYRGVPSLDLRILEMRKICEGTETHGEKGTIKRPKLKESATPSLGDKALRFIIPAKDFY